MADGGVTDVPRAVEAAKAIVAALGLTVDEAIVLHASNRLAVRVMPSDILARVAVSAHGAAQLEVDLARRLASTDSPVAALDSRVPPRVYEHDGFAITLWRYYPGQPSRELSPAAYAEALARLHSGMQRVDLATPHFMDRVQEAIAIVRSHEPSPELSDADRTLLLETFDTVTQAIRNHGAAEQLLHGEPHPGNVLNSTSGPLFVDLETCCRGPVEFDLAHVPEAVSECYRGIDRALLRACRILVLAMVAAWRFDPADRFPSGRQAARELLGALRAGPPYPALGAITGLD